MTTPGGGDRALVMATAGRLWGGTEHVWLARGPSRRPQNQQWHVLRSPSQARLIVPARPVWARAMLARHTVSARARLAQRGLEIGLCGPIAQVVPTWRVHTDAEPTARIESALGQLAGDTVGVGVRLGTPRPNRKPLLQAMNGSAETVLWAKVGDTAENARRVQTEFTALSALHGRLSGVEVPQPRGLLDHAGASMLVMSALPAGIRPWQWAPVPWEEMTELALVNGTTTARVADAPLWAAWESAAASLDTNVVARATSLIEQALSRWGDVDVRLATWHGDWTPWNMGRHDGRLQVWDWENYSDGVPVGSDPLHYEAQRLFAHRASTAQTRLALTRLERGLDDMGVAGRALDATWVMYLLQVAHRYVVAGAADPRVIERLAWVMARLEDAVGSPAGVRSAA